MPKQDAYAYLTRSRETGGTPILLNAARVAPERVWHSSQKSRHSKRDESLEMTLKVALTPELERWLWSWGDAVDI